MLKAEELNPQKPFSYQREDKRYLRESASYTPKPHREHLPTNIKGICIYCGWLCQKIKKHGLACQLVKEHDGSKACFEYYCPKCAKRELRLKIRELPENQLPWKINQVKSKFTRGHVRFNCETCGSNFYSWAVLGALCDHKQHLYPHFVCRFCCSKFVEAETQAKRMEDLKLKPATLSADEQRARKKLLRRYARVARVYENANFPAAADMLQWGNAVIDPGPIGPPNPEPVPHGFGQFQFIIDNDRIRRR